MVFLKKALETSNKMQLASVKLNFANFSNILLACATMEALAKGIYIHQRIVENGFTLNVVVFNALIYMYVKYESIEKSHKLFDKMHDVDIIS